jgi:NDP-sugar pyrophosphorylase family protein
MNIIIPLCGKGERFSKKGYTLPKPLIPVNNKPIIFHVLDSIITTDKDTIFIFYHTSLNNFNFSDIVNNYSTCNNKIIKLIPIENYTKGASETLFLGLKYCIINSIINTNLPAVCYDCNTFYKINTVDMIHSFLNDFKQNNKYWNGFIFYFKDLQTNPLYSYIKIDENKEYETQLITDIVEKVKISNNANCGIYGFNDTNLLYYYSNIITNNSSLYMNGECYISCIYKELLNVNFDIKIIPIQIQFDQIVSLGTPEQVESYCSTFL